MVCRRLRREVCPRRAEENPRLFEDHSRELAPVVFVGKPCAVVEPHDAAATPACDGRRQVLRRVGRRELERIDERPNGLGSAWVVRWVRRARREPGGVALLEREMVQSGGTAGAMSSGQMGPSQMTTPPDAVIEVAYRRADRTQWVESHYSKSPLACELRSHCHVSRVKKPENSPCALMINRRSERVIYGASSA